MWRLCVRWRQPDRHGADSGWSLYVRQRTCRPSSTAGSLGDRGPLPLRHGLPEPIFESNRAELRISGGNERTLAQQCSVVTRTRISDDCAWIVVRLEPSLDQRVEAKWFGPCHLDDAV